MNSNLRKKVVFIVYVTVLFLVVFGITSNVKAAEFSLEQENLDVKLNSTAYISYTGGTGSVTWESEDDTIATVEAGIVTGKKIGTTNIKAKRGEETATCKVNVTYGYINIGGNQGKNVTKVNLVLGEHDSETLTADVKDGKGDSVTGVAVTWTSNNTSVVTVDKTTGVIKAVKKGTATITASVAGATDTCEVEVFDAPVFTDFSKAKYETELNWTTETLKVTGINPELKNVYYYYVITPNNTKPNITKTEYGTIDTEKMGDTIDSFLVNEDEKYIYTRNLSKYAELNQDLYLWIIQTVRLDENYYNENGDYIGYGTKFVEEGKKLTRADLPKLNLILQSFNIGYFNGTENSEAEDYTYIKFNFPTETENRKFTIKVGRVTDQSILSKIQSGNYQGIVDLLAYAKSHDAVYTQNLTTTSEAYFRSDTTLFDGRKSLQNKAYYYIYVVFDDENDKYYPVEGVTLGQAWFSSYTSSWNLEAYTSSNFEWDGLTPGGDNTLINGNLPYTGIISITLAIIAVTSFGVIFYKKYSKFKDIK